MRQDSADHEKSFCLNFKQKNSSKSAESCVNLRSFIELSTKPNSSCRQSNLKDSPSNTLNRFTPTVVFGFYNPESTEINKTKLNFELSRFFKCCQFVVVFSFIFSKTYFLPFSQFESQSVHDHCQVAILLRIAEHIRGSAA